MLNNLEPWSIERLLSMESHGHIPLFARWKTLENSIYTDVCQNNIYLCYISALSKQSLSKDISNNIRQQSILPSFQIRMMLALQAPKNAPKLSTIHFQVSQPFRTAHPRIGNIVAPGSGRRIQSDWTGPGMWVLQRDTTLW